MKVVKLLYTDIYLGSDRRGLRQKLELGIHVDVKISGEQQRSERTEVYSKVRKYVLMAARVDDVYLALSFTPL